MTEQANKLRLSNEESNRLTREALETAMILLLKDKDFDKISISAFPKENINTAQSDLKSAINYEDLIKKALQNPDDDIVKVDPLS